MAPFDDDVKRAIPSEFYMISSSGDQQKSNESYNATKFRLPTGRKYGSVCTSAFLQQLYTLKADTTWFKIIKKIRKTLDTLGYGDQTPMLSSSRMMDKHTPLQIVPLGSGSRRAILIGINYVGQSGELKSSHSDCLNVRDYLVDKLGFREEEMMILMDDGTHMPPTKKNIEDAFIMLTQYSRPGDVNFISFSGHGGTIKDTDGDEEDGFDST